MTAKNNEVRKSIRVYINDMGDRPLNRSDFFEGNNIRPAIELYLLLAEKSYLTYTKVIPSFNIFYIYDPKEGIYIEHDEPTFKSLIGKIFINFSIDVVYKTVSAIVQQFKVGSKTHTLMNSQDQHFLAFNNGLLNMHNNEHIPHSPDYFVTTKLGFKYEPKAEYPTSFMQYLDQFCEGNEDRKEFLRSWLHIVVKRYTGTQTFLYLMGRARTGKSLFGLLTSALVGQHGTVITSLKALNNDPFEVYNLKDKYLIIISDTEFYRGDLSILKQVTGGDPLKARVKFLQGCKDFYPSGIVLIVGNYGLGSQDTSGAIERRLRLFIADNVINSSPEPLFYNHNGMWKGTLAKELPGIFNWIYNRDFELSKRYLIDTKKMVPSLTESFCEGIQTLNPIKTWISEELETGEGAHLGFVVSNDPKSQLEHQRRGLLYPAYIHYCSKQGITPLKHGLFTREFIKTAQDLGLSVRKGRTSTGIFIHGLKLKDFIYDRDRTFGGPILLEAKPVHKVETTDVVKIPDNVLHPAVETLDVYEPYLEVLSQKTPNKKFLNKYIRNHLPDMKSLLDEFFLDRPSTPAYREHVEKTFDKGLELIRKYGCIPYNYKQMGVSPRLIPINYGSSINTTKRVLRNQIFQILSNAGKSKFVIVDVDLISCYVSVLLGLYPKELEAIQSAIEGQGLWEFIKSEFEKNGKLKDYHKPFVKICVYASFFLGGTKAMMEGILESVREEVGMTKDEFRKSDIYETTYKTAQETTSFMMNSSIIKDFQNVAQYVKSTYMDEELRGPSGHCYRVSEINFRNVYPNWLQSYEITLLAYPIVQLTKEYPSIEVIGHYHDGNVLLLPMEIHEEVISRYQEEVTKLGYKLGLSYPQKLEIKKVYFPSE